MRIVLDTNVLVAGLLNPHGAPGRVLDLVLAGDHIPLVDDRIRSEYVEVLLRPRFGFAPADVAAVLRALATIGEPVLAPPLGVTLRDADDLPFLEVAVAGGADCLITGNLRHFPGGGPVKIVSPGAFLAGP